MLVWPIQYFTNPNCSLKYKTSAKLIKQYPCELLSTPKYATKNTLTIEEFTKYKYHIWQFLWLSEAQMFTCGFSVQFRCALAAVCKLNQLGMPWGDMPNPAPRCVEQNGIRREHLIRFDDYAWPLSMVMQTWWRWRRGEGNGICVTNHKCKHGRVLYSTTMHASHNCAYANSPKLFTYNLGI